MTDDVDVLRRMFTAVEERISTALGPLGTPEELLALCHVGPDGYCHPTAARSRLIA